MIGNIDRLGRATSVIPRSGGLGTAAIPVDNTADIAVVDEIFGAGGTLQISDPSAIGLSKRFYRVALEP